jgi:hypothetical protein
MCLQQGVLKMSVIMSKMFEFSSYRNGGAESGKV